MPWGLRFSTGIPSRMPPGWEGWRSPHQVFEGKCPLGSSTQAGVMPGTLQPWPHLLQFPPEHLDGRIPPGVRCPTSPKNKREDPRGV